MKIRTTLDHFNGRVEELGDRLHTMLAAKRLLVMTVESLDNDKKFSEISETIRTQFGETFNDKEADASLFIENWGRDVILNVSIGQIQAL
jgi:hypothetical protein